MNLTAHDLASIRGGEFRNREALKGKAIRGVSTDSRFVKPGDVFFALRGETFDGHKFVEQAVAAGAIVAVVEASSEVAADAALPMLVVPDTTHALGELARVYRGKFSLPVIAIGGSNGKTTTKEMVARVLGTRYNVLSTEGNLNNQIGVPHTLFRLTRAHEIAVVEIGTNHPGEIAHLCGILEPTHGLLTNIGREHLEFFGSVRGVAKEETALFACLGTRKTSVGFVNADDAHLVRGSRHLGRKVVYGFRGRGLEVRGKDLTGPQSACGRLGFRRRASTRATVVQLQVPGIHAMRNALAAAAVGVAFRVPVKKIADALGSFRAAGMRMELESIGGVLVLNDTYNANPDSMAAALHTLAAMPGGGKKIAVLADMRELGRISEEEHRRIGTLVTALRLEYLLTWGPAAAQIHRSARIPFAVHYDQKNVLAEYLAELVAPGDVVLVKGSRGMKMEDIVAFLKERLRTRPTLAG